MEKYNCPNCGAPIQETVCPYCGTVFYDFACINDKKPTYVRAMFNGNLFIFRAVVNSAEIIMEQGALPSFVAEFTVIPDDKGVIMMRQVMKQEKTQEVR